ncbi:MAG TPA: RHS repeat-associated core domain-containing protein, partial [Anaerolineae bacterium]|nr:RHS repeat-associated core domain-containing protein [Anaerolineae bacterium]
PTGAPLQDLAYRYDLAGHITAIHDRTAGSGLPNTPLGPDALDRLFSYDPLYRLISATGRETDRPGAEPPWAGSPRGVDLTRARPYTEHYTYDPTGNLLRLQHQAGGGSFTRDLTLAAGGNRLAAVTVGQTKVGYTYDAGGNLLEETTARHFEWDYADRLKAFRTQVRQAEPSLHGHYLYDAAGQRVKKVVRRQGGAVGITVYIDGLFEHHRQAQGRLSQENNTLHVLDDRSRVALVRVGSPFPDDTAPAVQYQLGDHLGSSHVVIDGAGSLINREEFSPYGETSFGSFAKKRYRFTGQERDEESGLAYHGARYYAPWLARWLSCDPAGMVDGLNLYVYTRGNPICFYDASGRQAKSEIAVPDYETGIKRLQELAETERAEYALAYNKETGNWRLFRGGQETLYVPTGYTAYAHSHYGQDAVPSQTDLDYIKQNNIERHVVVAPKHQGTSASVVFYDKSSGKMWQVNYEGRTPVYLVEFDTNQTSDMDGRKYFTVTAAKKIPSGGLPAPGKTSTVAAPKRSVAKTAGKTAMAALPLVGLYFFVKHVAEGNLEEAAWDVVGFIPIIGDTIDVADLSMLLLEGVSPAVRQVAPIIKKYPGMVLAPPTPGVLIVGGGLGGKLKYPTAQPQKGK